jgi:tetratricopeptide (TPR) repeat protein
VAVNREQVLQSAEKLLSRGKLDQALKEYLRVLEDNPKDISTLNKVGDLYVRMNRPSESIPYFTRIADFYSKDGFFLKAIAIFKKINKIDPAQLDVYDKLADLYHKQGLVQDARSQYQVLADHYQKNNRLKEAIAVYKKMAGIDPSDLRIQVRLADIYRAANEKDRGRHAVRPHRQHAAQARRARRGRAGLPEGARALAVRRRDAAQPRPVAPRAEEHHGGDGRPEGGAAHAGEPRALRRGAARDGTARRRRSAPPEQALALDATPEAPRLFLFRCGCRRWRSTRRSPPSRLSSTAPCRAASSRGRRNTSSRSSPRIRGTPGRSRRCSRSTRPRRTDPASAARASPSARRPIAARTWRPPPATTSWRRRRIRPTSRPRPGSPRTRRTRRLPSPRSPPRQSAAPAAASEPEYQELVIDLEDSASIHAPQPVVPSIDLETDEQAAPPPPLAPAPPPPRASRPTEFRSWPRRKERRAPQWPRRKERRAPQRPRRKGAAGTAGIAEGTADVLGTATDAQLETLTSWRPRSSRSTA